jgi:hypothetical protein
MRVRQSFVSNSSSSSFILDAKKITAFQLFQLENYKEISKIYQSDYEEDEGDADYCYDTNAWYVNNRGNTIELSTSQDTFDMEKYMESIDIPDDAIVDYY